MALSAGINSATINHADICAGGSGLSLALRLALGERLRTVVLVEREAYAVSNLVARMAETSLDQAPIWDSVESFDGNPWRGTVDILSAGFPCQPFSLAGKRKGTKDERWIWRDIVRIIREVRDPVRDFYVFLENVSGLTLSNDVDGKPGWRLPAGLWHVLGDLAALGFDAEWCCVRAEEVGASHERARIFIMGNARGLASVPGSNQAGGEGAHRGSSEPSDALVITEGDGGRSEQQSSGAPAKRSRRRRTGSAGASAEMADASNGLFQEPERRPEGRTGLGPTGAQVALASSGGLAESRQPSRQDGQPDGSHGELADATGPGIRTVPDRKRRRRTNHAGGPSVELVDADSQRRGGNGRAAAIAGTDGPDNGLPVAPSDRLAITASARCEECGCIHGNAGEEFATVERNGLPIFPPGPGLGGYGVIDDIRELRRSDPDAAWRRYQAELANTIAWRNLLEVYPEIEPAVRRVIDGSAAELDPSQPDYRIDRLRLVGGGVVPIAAALALCILIERLGVEL